MGKKKNCFAIACDKLFFWISISLNERRREVDGICVNKIKEIVKELLVLIFFQLEIARASASEF